MSEVEQGIAASLVSFLGQHRFAVLLMALVLVLFYGPIVEFFAPQQRPLAARVALGLTFTVLCLTAVFTVTNNRKTLWTSLLLGIPAITSELLDVSLMRSDTQLASHFLAAAFLGYVILVLLKFIFTSQQVTANTICAALCVYLLLATLWALAYSMLEHHQSGAFFYSLASTMEEGSLRLGQTPAGLEFYFSLVTMTTLGYGDIVPVSSAAQMLVTLQAVVGQMYLAVLVARLVGDTARESHGRDQE